MTSQLFYEIIVFQSLHCLNFHILGFVNGSGEFLWRSSCVFMFVKCCSSSTVYCNCWYTLTHFPVSFHHKMDQYHVHGLTYCQTVSKPLACKLSNTFILRAELTLTRPLAFISLVNGLIEPNVRDDSRTSVIDAEISVQTCTDLLDWSLSLCSLLKTVSKYPCFTSPTDSVKTVLESVTSNSWFTWMLMSECLSVEITV